MHHPPTLKEVEQPAEDDTCEEFQTGVGEFCGRDADVVFVYDNGTVASCKFCASFTEKTRPDWL